MKKIVLTTESSSDLQKETLNWHNIFTVPFSINFPDRMVYDGEIKAQEIYDFYEKTKKIPKTNAVSPYQYEEFFENISEKYPGCKIIHIGYSSACSCSFQNAALAIRECKKAKVYLIDSKNVSGGLGNLTLKAAEIIEENPLASAEELVEKITPYISKIRTAFVPDTLEFLKAGGRVSNGTALIASIINLKPRIDIIDGKLIASKKYRGSMQKVARHFVKDFTENRTFDKRKAYVFYSQGAEAGVINLLQEALWAQGFQKIEVILIGGVMTVHSGKGAIGMSAMEF